MTTTPFFVFPQRQKYVYGQKQINTHQDHKNASTCLPVAVQMRHTKSLLSKDGYSISFTTNKKGCGVLLPTAYSYPHLQYLRTLIYKI